MAQAVPLLDSMRSFPTPEHVAYRYQVAGPLIRLWAWCIDVLIKAGILLAVGIVFLIIGLKSGIGLWLMLFFVVDWLLSGLVEWRWGGRTPGKRACGIRVIGVDGLPAGLGACMLRNIMRFADTLPTAMAAIVAMVGTGDFRRLGDLAAGTLVVHDDEPYAGRALQAETAAKNLAATLPAEVSSLIDGPTGRALVAYVSRRRSYHPRRLAEMARHLAGPLAERLGLPATSDPDVLLCAVHHRLFSTEAGPEAARAAAFLDRRRPDWARLDTLVAGRAVPRELAHEPRGLAISRLYRSACADLALAEAYHLPARLVEQLHRLVARAHLRFYQRRGPTWASIRRVVLVEVPGRLYGDACLRTAFLAFFGVFLLSAILGAVRPETATAVMGHGFFDSLRDMYADPPSRRSADEAAVMHGFYVHHNVGIALACFASGIFLGVGSLVWLAFNGVVLGLAFGFMVTVDASTREHFFTFVTAHGPFELTGIALSGAAGLRLGLGLVATRGLPRLHGLMQSAREAVPIMAVAAASVAAAAPIEAWVSPSDLPVAAKRAVCLASGAVLAVYLVLLGRRGRLILEREAAHAP
jgi:uncharacterized membrane protein SpoIIM required for sporulation/uncharacterized RDD family membrane protein YckC